MFKEKRALKTSLSETHLSARAIFTKLNVQFNIQNQYDGKGTEKEYI